MNDKATVLSKVLGKTSVAGGILSFKEEGPIMLETISKPSEPVITINGEVLSDGAVMTFRVALSFLPNGWARTTLG